jgi:hypothetical protein
MVQGSLSNGSAPGYWLSAGFLLGIRQSGSGTSASRRRFFSHWLLAEASRRPTASAGS